MPDFRHWEGREPARRVADREEVELRPLRDVPGASVRVRDGQGQVKQATTVHPGPNAPLLMRIVRDPFALRPGDPKRERYLPEAEEARGEPRASVADLVREKREALRGVRPLRDVQHRPEPRERPFARARERAEEGR